MTGSAPEDELIFLPLGGTGEIGMNLNLYGYRGRWLMVDLGITFADGNLPGIDVLMPDPAFIEERCEDLAGLVLTHGHEDHIGAVAYLWPRLRCPVYATAFTAALVRGKLREAGLEDLVPITEVPMSGAFDVGPFAIELVTLTHSIPEPNALIIRTGAGTVLHTGDWKLDPKPLVGADYDDSRLRSLAEEGVLAMVCDSTNAMVSGESGSENEVREHLTALIAAQPNRVAVACFASNVARLDTVIHAAEESGRRVCIVGRSMHRFVAAARETGYLTRLPKLVPEVDIDYLPRDEVVLLCTGSQGEKRSALWRIAHDDHPAVAIDPGDTVIFSSRVIPGNEIGISALQNALVRKGIEVLSDDAHFVHVSGHPARDELAQMYQWVKPKISIPVHGEARHLAAHAKLAAACQVPQQIVAANGSVIRLAPGPAEIVDTVPTGRLALDGTRLVRTDSSILKMRARMSYNGAAAVTLVADARGDLMSDPIVSVHGLVEEAVASGDLRDIVEEVREAVAGLAGRRRRNDEAVKESARLALRRACNRLYGRKPITDVHLVRLPED